MPKTAYKRGQNIAEKHPNWKGGLNIWARKKVLERDNYTCQICKLKDKDIMDVAHIIPVRSNYKRRYEPQDIKNLIVLCPNCHRRFDKGLVELQ